MMIDRATEESLQKSKPKGKVETQGRNKGKRPEQRPKKQLIIIGEHGRQVVKVNRQNYLMVIEADKIPDHSNS